MSRASCNNQNGSYTNQDLSVDQLSYEIETIERSSSYLQNSESTSIPDHTRLSTPQHRDQVLPYRVDDTLIMPGNYTFKASRVLVPITSKLSKLFLASGMIYLLSGALIIGLETAIIMYSSSTFYRGFSIDCMMLTMGINLFIVAFSTSYSMLYIVRVLILVILCCLAGVGITALDLVTVTSCADDKELPLCQKSIAQVLKLTILGSCAAAGVYTGVIIAVVKRIQKKAISKPSDTDPH